MALEVSTMKREYSTGISSTCCCMSPLKVSSTISTASGPFWMPVSSAMVRARRPSCFNSLDSP
jgi:hypothetical protein